MKYNWCSLSDKWWESIEVSQNWYERNKQERAHDQVKIRFLGWLLLVAFTSAAFLFCKIQELQSVPTAETYLVEHEEKQQVLRDYKYRFNNAIDTPTHWNCVTSNGTCGQVLTTGLNTPK